MTQWDEGVRYAELFEVIKTYATRDTFRQVKALHLIRDNFTPFNNLPAEETKQLIEQILERHAYVIWYGGRPALAGVDTIATVAQWSGDRDWATRLLVKMNQALLDAYTTQPDSDTSRAWPLDGSMLTYGLETVVQGLKALQG